MWILDIDPGGHFCQKAEQNLWKKTHKSKINNKKKGKNLGAGQKCDNRKTKESVFNQILIRID